MAVLRELPVTSAPNQSFVTTLMGKECRFVLRHARRIDRWSFDLEVDGVAVIRGRRIVRGVNLVRPFGAGIGEIIAISFDGVSEPTLADLPSGRARLLHVDPDAMEAEE
jgi:hypothetical protein